MSISLDGVSASSGRHTVLDDLSLRIGPGVTVLAGPNGAGKSTLLSVVATLLRFRRGRVAVDGHDLGTVAGRADARRVLGFLPQDPAFPLHWTVGEALTYAAWLHRVPAAGRAAAVDRVAREVGVAGRSTDRLRSLSGGTRRRVMLAQTLVHQPAYLLLDEPTVGVDAEHRVEFRRTIRSIASDRVVVLSSHLTEDIELLADRVIVLDDGSVRFDGPPSAIAAFGTGAGDDERAIELGLRRLGVGVSATMSPVARSGRGRPDARRRSVWRSPR